MDEVKKSDFIYFQNEFLQDIKKLDLKFSEKISQLIISFQNNKLITDQKFELYNNKITSLSNAVESNTQYQQIKLEIDNFKKYVKEENSINSNKISFIERDLSNACFKYDNIFSNAISVPGLIGKGCKFPTTKSFYETINKNVIDLQNYKEKNKIDLQKYKNKLETLIKQFKIQIDNSKNQYFTFCNERILETKNEIEERFKIIEEQISNMRIENGKHSFELIQKADELKNKINKIDNITNEVDQKLNEEKIKYQKSNNELMTEFNSQKEEFKLIKIRFSELSEYIKDVRFMRNISFYGSKGNKNKDYNSTEFLKLSKQISKKLNFNKNQKISIDEEAKYLNNNREIINDKKIINNKDNNKENDNINKNTVDNENKTKSNIKLNLKEKIFNKDIYNNNSPNTNLKDENNNTISKNNNNISSISIDKITKYNNKENEYIKTDKSPIKKLNYLKTEESPSNEQKLQKNIFLRTQSHSTLKNQIQNKEFNTKIQTQNNFYIKNNIIKTENNSFNEESKSGNITLKFKKIFEKGEKANSEEIIKLLSKNDNNSFNLNIEIYNKINSRIIDIEDRINKMNHIVKIYFEKINEKIRVYSEMTNSLIIKMKKEKSRINLNSPIKIQTNSEYNIPLINNFDKISKKNQNLDLTDRNNSRKKNFDNISLLNIQDKRKNISSGKILSVIEPYLIKKFKCNNN